jgi:NAD+ synthase (glutamine-hydrolysing)
LWDYLKKSKASGYFLALSGGADSAAVSLVVYNMCKLLMEEIGKRKKRSILDELRNVVRDKKYVPASAEDICSKLFYTAYLATDNSSQETTQRAAAIAKEIGANHRFVNFSHIVKSYKNLASDVLGTEAKFEAEGGSRSVDLCLQNIQARNRMSITYMLAQMELTSRNLPGFLLVVTSSNLDESLRGYLTKYDCSSGDINPIGSMSKSVLR